ncbi:unnamed protein product, partial [Effrenium voratum]
AQRWAVQLVRQAEAEACRRGGRGSPAWEDAWRDALWTLAVQKRCVEVEARRCCAAAKRPPPPPPPLEESTAESFRDALRGSWEPRCLEMQRRLDVYELRLQQLAELLQGFLERPEVPAQAPEAPEAPGAGPLPRPRFDDGAQELSGMSFLSETRSPRPTIGTHAQELRQQLERSEAQRQDSARRLRALEAELAQLQEALRKAQLQLEEAALRLEEHL